MIQIVADIHAQKRNADARTRTSARSWGRSEAAPVPTVPKILQFQPPTGPAYKGSYWRKAL